MLVGRSWMARLLLNLIDCHDAADTVDVLLALLPTSVCCQSMQAPVCAAEPGGRPPRVLCALVPRHPLARGEERRAE